MQFEIFGPFYYSKKKTNGLVDWSNEAKQKFWETVKEDACKELLGACGCYVVATVGSNGARPYYVGLTAKRTFKAECEAAHVRNHINEGIAGKRLRACLYLIARKTPGGRFTKPSKRGFDDVEFLEQFLIGLAIDRNPILANRKKTKYLKNLSVRGFLNGEKGQPTRPARSFRKLMDR